MIWTFERRGSASLTFALIFGVLGLAGCTRKEPRRLVKRAEHTSAGEGPGELGRLYRGEGLHGGPKCGNEHLQGPER